MSPTVTFGELMLRLTPPAHQRFSQAAHFEITFGGAEANVAVALAMLGSPSVFVTKLPANEIGDRAVAELRGLGVDVTRIARGGDRLGVYFLEQGASQRPGKVIYDRAHSAVAEAHMADFDWASTFSGAGWFHWSGITPALSAAAADRLKEACLEARRQGLRISFDLNYRSKLWSLEEAGRILPPLMQYVDVCITSAEEARTVFGLDVPDSGPSLEEVAARALQRRFGFAYVALTRRKSGTASSTSWGAMLLADGQVFESPTHEITIVDRVGAGDSFTGGLIFSLRRGDSPQDAICFAVAASTLKHTIAGDYNLVSLAEVEDLAAGGSGGRVRR